MEVILRESIAALGQVGDIVKVKAGYARNYLIPKRLAYLASEANKKRLEAERSALEVKQAAQKTEAEKLVAQIEAVALTIQKESGEEDKLYGSVTAHDIEDALLKEGVTVDRKMINFSESIRSLGEHAVEVRVYAGVTATCKVTVVKA